MVQVPSTKLNILSHGKGEWEEKTVDVITSKARDRERALM